MGEPEGMVKTVFDAKTGELLGAHMIGAEVTEMIQGYAIARTLETTEAELMHTVFPHPTRQRNDARGGAGRLRPGHPLLGRANPDRHRPSHEPRSTTGAVANGRAIRRRRTGRTTRSSASRTGSGCRRPTTRSITRPAR